MSASELQIRVVVELSKRETINRLQKVKSEKRIFEVIGLAFLSDTIKLSNLYGFTHLCHCEKKHSFDEAIQVTMSFGLLRRFINEASRNDINENTIKMDPFPHSPLRRRRV